MLLIGLVVLGCVMLVRCPKPISYSQSLKVVRISNCIEVYYPASAKALVDKEVRIFRFEWYSQYRTISFYVRNVEKQKEQSFNEVLQLIRKGREAEGRQFVEQRPFETNQRVVATVLVFEHKTSHEMREWIVIENPYRKDHVVAVHWSSPKQDYDRVRLEIYPIIERIRLLNGPPEWLDDKSIIRRDGDVG